MTALRAISSEWNYKNFTRSEVACKCGCGDSLMHPEFMRKLQAARNIYGGPLRLTSAKRCAIHNARVGGAPFSFHKRGMAGDIEVNSSNRKAVLSALEQAGFTGVGLYQNFIHVDLGPLRRWFGGKISEDLWAF